MSSYDIQIPYPRHRLAPKAFSNEVSGLRMTLNSRLVGPQDLMVEVLGCSGINILRVLGLILKHAAIRGPPPWRWVSIPLPRIWQSAVTRCHCGV